MGMMAYSEAFSVLVVDDHHLTRRGIVSILAEIPGARVVGEASSGEDAVRMARSLAPDLVLMDLRMPGMGGLEAARRIRQTTEHVQVVAVTACTDEPGQRLLRNGIRACLGKNASRDEMQTVLAKVLRGGAPAIAEPASGPSDNPFDQLTAREMQICLLMLEGRRPADIAASLFITAKTVHTFRYRIYEKLGVNGDVELTRLASRYDLLGLAAPDTVNTRD